MGAPDVFVHPAVERMELRRKMMAAVDRLLEVVDVLVRELDDGTPDADLEPTIGAHEYPSRELSAGPSPLYTWAQGVGDEREPDADLEPSLASMLPRVDRYATQLFWDRVTGSGEVDLEREHDGREPSHGSNGGAFDAAWADQRHWAAGGDQGEREAVSEDEGTYRDGDDEPDRYPDCVNFLLHDQTRWGTYTGEPLERVDPDDVPGEFVACYKIGMSR